MGDFGGGAHGVTPIGEGSYSGAELSASGLSACAVRGAVRVSEALSLTYALAERVYLFASTDTAVSSSAADALRVGTSGALSEVAVFSDWVDGIVLRGNSRYESAVYALADYDGLRVKEGFGVPAAIVTETYAGGTFRAAGLVQSSAVSAGLRLCVRIRLNSRASTNRAASFGVPVRVRQGPRIGTAVSAAVYHANFRVITGRVSDAFSGAFYSGGPKWEHPEAPVRAWATPPAGAGRWEEIPGVSGTWRSKQVLGLTSDG